MAQYNTLAKFYDDVIGMNGVAENFIVKCFKKYHKNAKSLLDLGCGTGTNLVYLNKYYDVEGIDGSSEMIRLAKEKLPDVKFMQDDITSFNSNRTYDGIICLYDTINHIIDFAGWKRLFKKADEHLNDGGLFIFDINSIEKLNYMAEYGSFVHRFEKNYMIMDVIKKSKTQFDWDAKIFEHSKNESYKLYREVIAEASFSTEKIVTEVEKHFDILKKVDDMGFNGGDFPQRVYFVCKKKKSKEKSQNK
jgi:SAM-dependent methyltransferase